MNIQVKRSHFRKFQNMNIRMISEHLTILEYVYVLVYVVYQFPNENSWF